jgi:hypothetical protein
MRGFFVGVADRVISGILPLLEAFNTIDLSGIGQQVGDIIATLGQGFKTVFSIFQTESDLSLGEMLTNALKVANEMATRFVGAVELLKSAIDQGRLGELVGKALQLGAMTGANALVQGFLTAVDALARYFRFQLNQVITLFTGGFNESLMTIFGALPTLIGGLGVLIYS